MSVRLTRKRSSPTVAGDFVNQHKDRILSVRATFLTMRNRPFSLAPKTIHWATKCDFPLLHRRGDLEAAYQTEQVLADQDPVGSPNDYTP